MAYKSKGLNTLTDLFYSQRFAVLSTQKDGQPYASLVAFSFNPELTRLFFLTARKTRKYETLLACDRVAVLVHSAANQAEDFEDAISVTALGRAVTVEDKTRPVRDFLDRHPGLADFARDPDTAMVAVIPETYLLVSRFRDVEKIIMGP